MSRADRLFLTALVLACAAVISGAIYATITENSWTARCHRAGGHNVPHFEGMMLVGKALVARYSDHCIVDGREVRV